MTAFSKSALAGLILACSCTTLSAQDFVAGEPIGSVNEAGVRVPMSSNVKV